LINHGWRERNALAKGAKARTAVVMISICILWGCWLSSARSCVKIDSRGSGRGGGGVGEELVKCLYCLDVFITNAHGTRNVILRLITRHGYNPWFVLKYRGLVASKNIDNT
jgi:hypothetical protein